MILIDPSVESFNGPDGYTPLFGSPGSLEIMEKAGRTCYHSEKGEITEETASDFCMRMLKSGHLTVLEHSNLVFRGTFRFSAPNLSDSERASEVALNVESIASFTSPYIVPYSEPVYSIENKLSSMDFFFQGNLRAWIEAFLPQETAEGFSTFKELTVYLIDKILKTLKTFVVDSEVVTLMNDVPERLRRKSFRIVTNITVLKEITRHRRGIAFCVESQRYVDPTDTVKNPDGVRFIRPHWFNDNTEDKMIKKAVNITKNAFYSDEKTYIQLRKCNLSKQDSRVIIPNGAATVIFVTADVPEWKWIMKLRNSTKADPEMQIVAGLLQDVGSL
jgi:thymidylate synthase ThyX